ncbi:MAG: glycoside hydrolase family 95 protein [Candidatus Gastranaerophilales bacterium]|nr:glycoside hydrolase family 95 protein [Candidatus Gastranaerophilales bacterium]
MGRLFFEREADCFAEALPIGNGRLGAMIYGGTEKELLQLNEDTIWYGGPMNRINPEARKNLETVRELIFDGKIPEAEELLRYCFSGTPATMRPYQSLGECQIQMVGTGDVKEYERELSLDEAVAKVRYRREETTYTRTYFCSQPAQVIAVEFAADLGKAISFDVLLTRRRYYDSVRRDGKDMVCLCGNLGGGSDFALACKVCVEGGTVQCLGEHLVVRNADRAWIYLAAASTYREENPKEYVTNILEQAARRGFERLKKEHIKDYQALYGRVSLELPSDAEKEKLTTDRRLAAVREGEADSGLVKLYFDYGRYLLLSSSRKGSLPANLQGIWNDQMEPSWDSKYTININTEMNYWPAEPCNLPECHEPLFEHLRKVMESGQRTAREMYGCRGFVAHHNVDIWADTAPQDIYIPATYWVMGGAWLCTHLWMHYEYTLDLDFLADVYDILEQAVLFFEDFLVEREGVYLICPSVSPENTYIMKNGIMGRVCASSTMDNEILKDLLDSYEKASALLGKQSEIRTRAKEIRERLPQMKIGKHGQIMEWMEDYDEKEPGHRHVSQLYALHPGNRITVDGEPELAEAARRTLERRISHGGGYTGWSCAWLINFYARLWDGERAWDMLCKLLRGSTYPNLMDNHPKKVGSVFQIDGNFGGCAAILEMLVQSDGERVALLPACPAALGNGSLRGVRVKGNAFLDMEWGNGKVISARLRAQSPFKRKILWNGRQKEIVLEEGQTYELAAMPDFQG